MRSGDTEDNWFSDLAVGWSGDQTKAGSLPQSERLSKYNRLLAIEAEMPLPVNPWPMRFVPAVDEWGLYWQTQSLGEPRLIRSDALPWLSRSRPCGGSFS